MKMKANQVKMELIPQIENIRQILQDYYGALDWWPGDSPDEIAIGAVLTQNTSWSNAEKAIVRMKNLGLLSFPAILSANLSDLAETIRPSGYFNQKAKKLKALAKTVCQNGHETILQSLSGKTTDEGRTLLLSVWGIGKETADAILLYAIGHRIFVVDEYTKRIFSRHGILSPHTEYETVRKMVEMSIPAKTSAYNEFHAGVVHLGKDFCHRQVPDCTHCPLGSLDQYVKKGKYNEH
jgi:endonuclease III related protein